MVQQVRKGDPITALAWNEMAAAINNNLAARGGAVPPRPIPVTIKNRTEFTVQAGGTLTVYKGGTQRISSLSPENARKAWQNNGFQLDGYSSGTGGVPALVLDSIPEGGIGRALVPGLCAGFVTNSSSAVPDLCTFDAANGVFSPVSSGGEWKVIAYSNHSSYRRFCYLFPIGGGTSISFVLANGTTAVKDTVRADNTYIQLQGVTGYANRVNIKGARWYIDGPNQVVTHVSCDSNGDLSVNIQNIGLGCTFS